MRKLTLQYIQNVPDTSLANKTLIQYIFVENFSLQNTLPEIIEDTLQAIYMYVYIYI